MRCRKSARAIGAILLLASALFAHVRLIHSGNGKSLYWQDPAHISVTISSQGSDDLSDNSHRTAILGSIAAWNKAGGTLAHLIENTSAVARARTDWAADDLHLVWFDETGSCGYFPAGSGSVAITPVWFTSGGRISDADVLFNGLGYSFTTSATPGRFDIEDIATHELGHLLGLDHSGFVGASLYPYVSPGTTLLRSISSDDEYGLRDAYPAGFAGSISGTVKRQSNAGVVRGAYVVARSSSGRTVASALAAYSGAFAINGLLPGDYELYATPLDFPVSSGNLTAGHVVQTDFRSTDYGTVSVAAAAAVSVGDLLVDADSSFSLGRNYDSLPLAGVIGDTRVYTLHGSGLLAGSSIIAADPSIAIVVLGLYDHQVQFSATVPAGAAGGHVDLIATSPLGEKSVLPGALEIVPSSPQVLSVSPGGASDAGGADLTVTGSNFRAGLRLVIGERIYTDGVAGGCSVIDANTITLTTAPTSGGTYDVVAIDASGVEGRLVDGMQFITVPAISSVFPLAGATLGGTSVTLVGTGFVQGSTVRIDGVTQPNRTVVDTTRIVLTTEPGVPGGPYVVEVENPGPAIATAAFAYSAAPDPSLTLLDPALCSTAGSVVATLHGAGFAPTTAVVFGADPATGSGGASANSVTFIDAQTLQVVVPAHPSGVVSVMVSEPATGQATLQADSFTYQDSGGGGGCAPLGTIEHTTLRGALEGSWWILAALIGAIFLARSRPAANPAH